MKTSGFMTLVLALAAPLLAAPAAQPVTIQDLGARADAPQMHERQINATAIGLGSRQENNEDRVTKRSERAFNFKPRDVNFKNTTEVKRSPQAPAIVVPSNFTWPPFHA